MPVYEYKCEKCNHKYEALVKSDVSATDVSCPACNSTEKRKLFSTFSASVNSDNVSGSDYCAGGNCNLNEAPSCSSGFCGLN